MVPIAWGALPVFDAAGEGYVNRGAFVVPLFEGAPPPAEIDLIKSGEAFFTLLLVVPWVSGISGGGQGRGRR